MYFFILQYFILHYNNILKTHYRYHNMYYDNNLIRLGISYLNKYTIIRYFYRENLI